MTQPLRIYRLWRTSGILCAVGAIEFGYVAWTRHTWWPLIGTAGLVVVSGLALRRARKARHAARP
ncbi:MAG: hypothetical protein ABJB33_06515 [Gemmatimonadota bacterium]